MKPKRDPKSVGSSSMTPTTQGKNLTGVKKRNKFDSLLALAGSGRDLWADEHADEYVARLREDWK